MKKILLILLISMFVCVNCYAQAPRFQKGYVKKDGTYVQPTIKTKADGYKWNNYSTKGNTNPYSGRKGTVKNTDYQYKPYRPRKVKY